MQELTKRQRAIFEYIRSSISERGFPPTVAEIQAEFSFASPTSAVDHLKALSKKGFVRLHRGISRGIELLRAAGAGTPLVGDIAAGRPALAVENIVEVLDIDTKLFSPRPDFALRVKGDSMIEAGINDGDILLVKKGETAADGDVVVAIFEDEATVKRFYRKGKKIVLHPENESMEDIVVSGKDGLTILGVGVGVIRRKL